MPLFLQSCVKIYIWQLWSPCHTQAYDLYPGHDLSWSLRICMENSISKTVSHTSHSLCPGWVMNWSMCGVFGCSCVQMHRSSVIKKPIDLCPRQVMSWSPFDGLYTIQLDYSETLFWVLSAILLVGSRVLIKLCMPVNCVHCCCIYLVQTLIKMHFMQQGKVTRVVAFRK